tara:strand:+ start:237 stop:1400 length:1164 start_codon:yes stop_codon:yes gene_type:complete
MKIYVLIQSRSSSSRLPFKSLLSIGEYFTIELLYKRIFSKIYDTIVLTSEDNSDDYFSHLSKQKKIKVFRGNLLDVKRRFLSFSKNIKGEDIIVRLTGDNLFIDKDLIKLAISKMIESKKDYLFIGNKFSNLPLGISVEIFKNSHFVKNNNFSKMDKEHVTYSYDKLEKNSIKIEGEKKSWKKLVCTMDYLENYLSIKKAFESIKNPARISWQKISNILQKIEKKKISYENKFNLISLKSKKLTKKNIIDIANLKKQEWNFSLSSHVEHFKINFQKNDLNNMIYINDKLVGYTILRKKKTSKNKPYLLIDTVIIHKDYRKKKIGAILMNFNNNEIFKNKLDAYLQCKSEHIEFYKKFYWKKFDKKNFLSIKNDKNLNLMCFYLDFRL